MKLSPLLREKLKTDPPQNLKCVIEVRPDRVDYIIEQLQEMGISIFSSPSFLPRSFSRSISSLRTVPCMLSLGGEGG